MTIKIVLKMQAVDKISILGGIKFVCTGVPYGVLYEVPFQIPYEVSDDVPYESSNENNTPVTVHDFRLPGINCIYLN